MTDWVKQARQGKQAAYRALYDAHVDAIWRLCSRVLQRSDLAEDCTQDSFIKAFARLESLQDDSGFASWLYRIAYHRAVDMLRRECRYSVNDMNQLHADEPAPDPLLQDRLIDALAQLDDIYRDVFIRYHLIGQKHREISDMLNIPTGTSKRRLSVARSQLQSLLDVEPEPGKPASAAQENRVGSKKPHKESSHE